MIGTEVSEMHLNPELEEVINTANAVAIIKCHAHVEPVHLLAALLRAENGIACQALDRAGISYWSVRGSIVEGKHPFAGNARPHSEQTTNVINAAKLMAFGLGSSLVHTEHLLLVLLEKDDIQKLLREDNVNPVHVRAEVYERMHTRQLRASLYSLQEGLRQLEAAQAIAGRSKSLASAVDLRDTLQHVTAAIEELERHVGL